VTVRLDRVEKSIEYLRAEETREKEAFSLNMPEADMFTARAKDAFDVERAKVLVSAKRPKNRR
jgi:hypothetical protein